MITIHIPTAIPDGSGGKNPVMPKHRLKALKDTKTFKTGDVADCFIQKNSTGTLSIFDANFLNHTDHYENFTLNEAHNSFEEIEILPE